MIHEKDFQDALNAKFPHLQNAKMRIWHLSNLDAAKRGEFKMPVRTIAEGYAILTTLAHYDLSLGERIDCNVQGIDFYNTDTEQWEDATDEDGESANEVGSLLEEEKTSFP